MKHVEILPFFYNSSRPLVYILKSLLIFHLMKCKKSDINYVEKNSSTKKLTKT